MNDCVNYSDLFANKCKALNEKTRVGCSSLCPFYKNYEKYEAEVKKCKERNNRLGY